MAPASVGAKPTYWKILGLCFVITTVICIGILRDQRPNSTLILVMADDLDANRHSKTQWNYTLSKHEEQFLQPASNFGTPKTLLFWTKMWDSPKNVWWSMTDKLDNMKAFQSPLCKYQNCILSANRSNVADADLLLFNFADTPNWPKIRLPHQVYAHYVWESPDSVPPNYINIQEYNGKINTTIHYREDADVTFRYGYVVSKQSPTEGVYTPKKAMVTKPKSIVWPVSHCPTPSKRHLYAKELAKHIDVDIYGKCGPLKCNRKRSKQCMDMFESTYKFYIAFENSICKDYISEKPYEALKRELIPIVLGGGNYSKYFPPHSYIDARDFASPEKLAEYLTYLIDNPAEYNAYFQWKQTFEIEAPWIQRQRLFCQLCEGLHTGSLHRPAYDSYNKWYYGIKNKRICNNDFVPKILAAENF